MSPITHFLASWTLGEVACRNQRDRILGTWCGVLPDADGLGVIVDLANSALGRPDSWYYGLYHHGFLHGLPAAVVLPGVLSLFAVHRVRVFLVGFAAVHLHLICDVVGSRGPGIDDVWPIHYLAPLSDSLTLSWRGQWALNAWQNVVFTLVLLAVGFTSAIRSGHSPLGAISRRLDAAFVEAVRDRWRRRVGGD